MKLSSTAVITLGPLIGICAACVLYLLSHSSLTLHASTVPKQTDEELSRRLEYPSVNRYQQVKVLEQHVQKSGHISDTEIAFVKDVLTHDALTPRCEVLLACTSLKNETDIKRVLQLSRPHAADPQMKSTLVALYVRYAGGNGKDAVESLQTDSERPVAEIASIAVDKWKQARKKNDTN